MPAVTAVTSMKDEAPYILEWVAYHRSIGFNRLVILANDCTDGTHEMLVELHTMGEIEYIVNEVPRNTKPHSHALKLATRSEAVRSADFVAVLDADEFLVIKQTPHNVSCLIETLDTAGADMMVIPWRVYGSSSLRSFVDVPVTERFSMSMDSSGNPKSGLKTFFRNSEDLRLAIHFPKGYIKNGKPREREQLFRWIDPDGHQIDRSTLTWNGGRNIIRRERAEIAHYMIKSLDEYLLKIFRGDGLMNSNRHGIDYWRKADSNAVSDLIVADCAPGFHAEYARLMAVEPLRRLHSIAVERRKARLIDIMANSDVRELADILWKSTSGSITDEDVKASRKLVENLSPAPEKGPIMEGDLPRSLLVHVHLPEQIGEKIAADSVADACRASGVMFWSQKEFDRRPGWCLFRGLNRAKKRGRASQVTCRYVDNLGKHPKLDELPVDDEITVIISDRPEGAALAELERVVLLSPSDPETVSEAFDILASLFPSDKQMHSLFRQMVAAFMPSDAAAVLERQQ